MSSDAAPSDVQTSTELLANERMLDVDRIRRAMNECRIPSDITQAIFGNLPRIAEAYNRPATDTHPSAKGGDH